MKGALRPGKRINGKIAWTQGSRVIGRSALSNFTECPPDRGRVYRKALSSPAGSSRNRTFPAGKRGGRFQKEARRSGIISKGGPPADSGRRLGRDGRSPPASRR